MIASSRADDTVAIVDMRSGDVEQAFIDTLRNTGFAVLRHPPLDAGRLQRMDRDWLAFFLDEGKWDYLAGPAPSGNTSGYIPPDVSETAVGHSVRDLKEFFHVAPGTRMPPGLEADARSHLEEAAALGRLLLSWIDRHCGDLLPHTLRGRLAASLSRGDSLLRILHYPPLTGGEPADAVRAAAHEDINLLTLLPVSSEPGLQVRCRDGHWRDVPGAAGDVIVNSGDMLQEASGRRMPSTSHRVINPARAEANRSRISMPYFLAPQPGVRLSQRYTAGSYLRERLEQIAG